MNFHGWLISFFSLCSITCLSQQTFSVRGRAEFCYPKTVVECCKNFNDDVFFVALSQSTPEPLYGEQFQLKENGDFFFKNYPAGNYTLAVGSFTYYTKAELLIDRNIENIRLCVDEEFRPIPEDSIKLFIEEAKTDILNERPKLYVTYPCHAISTKTSRIKAKKSADRLRRKYNLEILTTYSCPTYDREAFLTIERYLTYNEIVSQHLDLKHGKAWRRNLHFATHAKQFEL
jgi:hypothetical protein